LEVGQDVLEDRNQVLLHLRVDQAVQLGVLLSLQRLRERRLLHLVGACIGLVSTTDFRKCFDKK
jgi:hypothetical protein